MSSSPVESETGLRTKSERGERKREKERDVDSLN